VRQAAEAAGAVGFLTKPITLSSLYDMLVETFAGGGKPRSALPEATAPNLTGTCCWSRTMRSISRSRWNC
jgi:hypothetical protein